MSAPPHDRVAGAVASPRAPRVVVAGVGSEYRGDDGVGPRVAARVAALLPEAHDVRHVGDPLELLGCWDGADLAVVIDATRSGGIAGSIRCVELVELQPDVDVVSTHGLGLYAVLRLSRAMDRAPRRVVVVGIEGADFGHRVGLTPPVEAAAAVAARRVVELLKEVPACA